MIAQTITRNIKCLMSFVLFTFCLTNLSLAKNLSVESKITNVTVYPGSARVTREIDVDLTEGEHSLILKNIIPQLDENSLTVNGQGSADVKIFGAYIKREYTEQAADKRVEDLTQLIESLGDQIKLENQNLGILRKEREYLDSIKLFSGNQVPKDLVTSMPSVESLEGVRKFLSEKYADIEKRNEEIRLKIRDLTRQQQVAQQQLNELRSFGSKQQRTFVIDLECSRAGEFTLNVSYLVYGAHWRSLYDARADYKKGEVELTAFGMIKQTTGEDWENVQLTLSTAQPTLSGRMPEVTPWIIQPMQPITRRRAETVRGLSNAVQSKPYSLEADIEFLSEDAPMELKKSAAKLDYSQVEHKGISANFKITRPVAIKSDGTENKYPIATQILKADYEYSSYPRVATFAYLRSRVINAPKLQLLSGQVNLFLEGDYIGKSSIDQISPGEEFDLYLGIDESVKVKREQISKKVDDVLLGGLKSPNRKTTFEYKLTVENYKDKVITVNLFEAIPVSQNDRIKVKTNDVKPKPTDEDWKDHKGIWRWEFKLKPDAKKEITYRFSVDHPRDMVIPGI